MKGTILVVQYTNQYKLINQNLHFKLSYTTLKSCELQYLAVHLKFLLQRDCKRIVKILNNIMTLRTVVQQSNDFPNLCIKLLNMGVWQQTGETIASACLPFISAFCHSLAENLISLE